MTSTRYYSPRLERELISRLYLAAKVEGVPMTKLASRLIRCGLDAATSAAPAESGTVAEEPPEVQSPFD